MKVNFFAPINALGYGQHSYHTIKEFEKRGHKVALFPPYGNVSFKDYNVQRWLDNRQYSTANDIGIMIFCEDFLMQFCGKPRIGFPVFELEKFTPIQLAAMRSCDYIFTPSQWGKGILAQNKLHNVRVVNEGYDPELYKVREISRSEEMNEEFTFIHVGKFEERKGTLQLIECFSEAFDKETVRLILHVHNQFMPEALNIVRDKLNKLGFYGGSNYLRRKNVAIEISNPVDSAEKMANLYARADCAVFPTKAEGWGLPILESIASGIPTIVGNWTGQSEYLGEENMFGGTGATVSGFKKQIANDGVWFQGDRGEWYAPTNESVIYWMKEMFKNARQLRKASFFKEEVERIRQFTWARAAQQLESALEDVCGK